MEWQELLSARRPRKSTSVGDHRVEFERDYDRAVFSTPVKRLQDKAQVFPLEAHDAIRTRLTHSLEVSSVSRGLATAVAKWLVDEGEIIVGADRAIEAIAATCGLIHDLGNPPFGHAGEDAIRHWVRDVLGEKELRGKVGGNKQFQSDFLLFEGNAQSLRLLTKLQVLADFNGLNMTYGTLSASCKYVAPSHAADSNSRDKAWTKPGYFASETDLVERMREITGTGETRNPITFLVEAADDIVYSVADIEDGVKKGVLRWIELRDQLDPRDPYISATLNRMERILRSGRPKIPAGLPDDTYASAFRTAAIAVLVPSVVEEFKKRYVAIMKGSYKGELVEDCAASSVAGSLLRIARARVYSTSSTLKLELMGRKIICDLMTIFSEGATALPRSGGPKSKTFPGKVGMLLSENYRRVFQQAIKSAKNLPEGYHRLQLVTDYVCGMTDTFAKRVHSELTNGG